MTCNIKKRSIQPLILFIAWGMAMASCRNDELEVETACEKPWEPMLTSVSFKASSNPCQLVEDVRCEIVGDSMVECLIGHLVVDRELVPHVGYRGQSILADGQPMRSDETRLDFRKPVRITVINGLFRKDYTVCVHTFTGLPVVWVETEGRREIASKETYLKASFRLDGGVSTFGEGEALPDSVSIKGRGNSTWTMPKKPYQLKFDRDVSLLDEPRDRSWVLLSNYADKTSLRNHLAFYMGGISTLDYTPRFHFVELMLNGEYMGTYQLGEKVKVGECRVNVSDDGFLLEVDSKAGDGEVTFFTSRLGHPVNIKAPDVSFGDADYEYVRNYVQTAEDALYADNFTDENEGWRKYMDMDSFVEWYLVNEIARNTDASFYTSCYMSLRRGGKPKMGPLWDFDIAFGNVNYNGDFSPTGLMLRWHSWYSRLFQDPAFVAKVKERFDYFYSRKDDIMGEINDKARYLRLSVEENNNKWGTFYTYTVPNYNIWGSYLNEVQNLKYWLNERFEWLKREYDKM